MCAGVSMVAALHAEPLVLRYFQTQIPGEGRGMLGYKTYVNFPLLENLPSRDSFNGNELDFDSMKYTHWDLSIQLRSLL